MLRTLQIDKRYNGPPASANGGYICGLMAEGISGPVNVALKAPPPLERDLTLEERDGGRRFLFDSGRLLAESAPDRLDLDVPLDRGSVGPDAGGRAPDRDAPPPDGGFVPFGGCFVCGENRPWGDGLNVFAKPIGGDDQVLAVWQPHVSFCHADGTVKPKYIWCALDCPGYMAVARGEPALLARMTGEILQPLDGRQPATVIGWSLDRDGQTGSSRKRRAGTAVFDGEGRLVAKAQALWVVVKPEMLAELEGAAA